MEKLLHGLPVALYIQEKNVIEVSIWDLGTIVKPSVPQFWDESPATVDAAKHHRRDWDMRDVFLKIDRQEEDDAKEGQRRRDAEIPFSIYGYKTAPMILSEGRQGRFPRETQR